VKIAQLAPLFSAVPPTDYGGTERVISTLTDELVRRGHDVTLFASAGSKTKAKLEPSAPGPLWRTGGDPGLWHAIEIDDLAKRSNEFDVIHNHIGVLPWLAGDRYQAPLVTTIHNGLDEPEQRKVLDEFRDWPLVSISNSQRRPVESLNLNWIATVYHGLDLEHMYTEGKGDGGYLAFVSRLAPEKGPAIAIKTAIKAGMKIKLGGNVSEQDYFDREVKPLLDHPLVEWVGEQDDRGKNELVGNAVGFLVPIQWDEPFGLAFIEALATGTPVVSINRGSLPELMEHGKHGFLVSHEDELVDAIQHLGEIDRHACRRWVIDQFSPDRMARGYEAVYEQLVRKAA
jgi:glycosyltransferase involved in cell wall biosynthesis